MAVLLRRLAFGRRKHVCEQVCWKVRLIRKAVKAFAVPKTDYCRFVAAVGVVPTRLARVVALRAFVPPNRVVPVAALGVVAHRVVPLVVRVPFRPVLHKVARESAGKKQKSDGLLAAAFGHVAF